MTNSAGLSASSVIVPRLSPSGKASSSDATPPSITAPASTANESLGTVAAPNLEPVEKMYTAIDLQGGAAPSESAPSEFATDMSSAAAMSSDEFDNSSLIGDRERDEGWDLLTEDDDEASEATSENESN
jgi:hypothetical protein